MSLGRLLLRNLVYHWRGNLAVLLGVVVGTAVLTGALLVGDSLRGSLRELTARRLGWVDHALVAGHFFRGELAEALTAERVRPLLLLRGTLVGEGGGRSKVVVYGADSRFWPPGRLPLDRTFWDGQDRAGIVLGAALANDLGVRVGQQVSLRIQSVSSTPRETVLGRRKADEVVTALARTVAAILPENDFGSQFSLQPGPAVPRNAFVPLAALQQELRRQERTLPEHPVNGLLAAGAAADLLHAQLRRALTLEDFGLLLRQPRPRFGAPAPGYLSLESRQLFFGANVAEAAHKAGLEAAPTLVYLVNNLAMARHQTVAAASTLAPPGSTDLLRPALAYYGPLQASYAVVAALDPELSPPLGPFLLAGRPKLQNDEILLTGWEGSPLADARPGEVLTLTYFQPQEEGQLHEDVAAFRLAAVIPLQGAARDPNLTPQFPGITDRLTLDAWDPPFPFDRTRIRPADERYWTAHRTTPKAYVTLRSGRKLWGSRFGQLTSLRIVPPAGGAQEAAGRLVRQLDPAAAGLAFQDVRAQGAQASAGSNDFGLLFLGFSFFLIAAALLLVALLFRLNLERRAAELGLLLAAGFRRRPLRRLFLAEGALIALVGGLLGSAGALLYAGLLLAYLRASWPGGLDQSFLQLHTSAVSFGIGFVGCVLASLLAIAWATRGLVRVPPSALLAGATADSTASNLRPHRARWAGWIAALGALLSAGSLAAGFVADDVEMKAGAFFASGALALIALLGLTWAGLRAGRHRRATAVANVIALGVRNAGRHPLRSFLTTGMLAAAMFLVVAVQVFHRDAGQDFLSRGGGSGGFALLAESELPIYQDWATAQGQAELNLPAGARDALRRATVFPLRLSAGDDVSCLNLYRPLQPRLLGVPRALVARGGFHFAATLAQDPEEKANPWLLLQRPQPDGAMPVFGEANTVQWVLKSGLGQDVPATDGEGRPVRLRIVGLLQDSVFQSELVTSERNFLEIYPQAQGFRRFLIDVPPEDTHGVKVALEDALADFGLFVTSSRQRLAAYLAVENTYLATFQALGGLGLLLGALGLAVVLLRNVWERRAELALLRAVGFRRSTLGWLVLAETGWLLLWGLAAGASAALLAVAPHLGGGQRPWASLAVLVGLVLVVALGAAGAALALSLRTPLLPALRKT